MMKTWQFEFSIDGKNDEIQFCDPSAKGALDLFWTWIFETYGVNADVDIRAIVKVYNKDDHEYYKDEYDTTSPDSEVVIIRKISSYLNRR